MIPILLFFIFFHPGRVNLAELSVPANTDTIYSEDIASVLCHVAGLPLSMPVIELGGGASLSISFDDLRSGSHRYKYEVIHTDMNWNKDELDEYDYIDGFNRSEIRTYAYSTNRNLDYTHYRFELPNNDLRLKISGNFLLHVYEELRKGQRIYLFTRRIMVVEPKVKVNTIFVRPTDGLKYRSHQEIDFEISVKGFPVYNSRQEITCTVMQNGRWSTAVTGLKQNRDKPELLVFDFIDKVSFPAGKEFRFFDIRSLEFRTRFVKKITENANEIIVTLNDDKVRDLFNFLDDQDANGRYIIENQDRPDPRLSSEYVWVDFTLKSPEFFDQQVYLMGTFTDWQCKSPFLLKYDDQSRAYLGSALLKQGYYNYGYVVAGKGGDFSASPIDGDWYETENDYQVLVYYRPFGARYDRLIAFHTAKP
ncbi:MAG: DUF5103 domain-containing protein [Saprospiraceae bacterium]|nr:DUF5103 domain-containing protein [Saprospiraceae bacterium]